MWARCALLLAASLCLTGCGASSQCRPCGPGILGNAFVPQGFFGTDFRPACQGHDKCYATPGSCRACCDEQFYQDLCCACECSHTPRLCKLKAWQWYMQVRLFGGQPYQTAQHTGTCDSYCIHTDESSLEPIPDEDFGS